MIEDVLRDYSQIDKNLYKDVKLINKDIHTIKTTNLKEEKPPKSGFAFDKEEFGKKLSHRDDDDVLLNQSRSSRQSKSGPGLPSFLQKYDNGQRDSKNSSIPMRPIRDSQEKKVDKSLDKKPGNIFDDMAELEDLI